MRLLLDTHIFLWIADDSPRLTMKARELVDNASAIYVSSAAIWEVAVKARIGKLIVDPDELLLEIDNCGFEELPVLGRHAAGVARLPLIHNDPFDRLFVAQVISEKMQLLTADAKLAEYSPLVTVV